MKRVQHVVNGRLLRPLTLIEIFLCIALVVWGFYTLTPLYHEDIFTDAWSNVFFRRDIFITAAVWYIIVGLGTLLGIVLNRRRVIYYGMALTFMAYAYLTIAKLLAAGPHRAAYWIFYLTLALVTAVCYIWERTNGEQ